ncbi:hypothetical protein [Vacuolonema iberomarrocanum]|uniref:hypothetical protein n=1 Tax=Vacuolonema iberomarrocanum TaxID=3454632 RepID=UPI003F6DECF2
MTPEEVRAVIHRMSGVHRLIVQLLYGSGLRLREAMQLCIKDLDFPQSYSGVQPHSALQRLCGARRAPHNRT